MALEANDVLEGFPPTLELPDLEEGRRLHESLQTEGVGDIGLSKHRPGVERIAYSQCPIDHHFVLEVFRPEDAVVRSQRRHHQRPTTQPRASTASAIADFGSTLKA